jgi:uncharacterized HhH-GPD family protein
LIELSYQLPRLGFSGDEKADELIFSSANAFLFGVIADQLVAKERAWAFPLRLQERIGTLEPETIVAIGLPRLMEVVGSYPALHRLWRVISQYIYAACIKLIQEYEGEADNIWKDEISAAEIERKLVDFRGIGQKKAAMVVTLFREELGMEFINDFEIDVASDVLVQRVFYRSGLSELGTHKDVVRKARVFHPSYPGIFARICWLLGRHYCYKNRPKCEQCPITDLCEKRIEENA